MGDPTQTLVAEKPLVPHITLLVAANGPLPVAANGRLPVGAPVHSIGQLGKVKIATRMIPTVRGTVAATSVETLAL